MWKVDQGLHIANNLNRLGRELIRNREIRYSTAVAGGFTAVAGGLEGSIE